MNVGTILGILAALAKLFKLLAGVKERQIEETAETERAKAEAMDHEELQKETDRWRRKS